jgi:VIT1/CCC1 family predicted Fe2+/Mn2+ transporter/rubrerythrin
MRLKDQKVIGALRAAWEREIEAAQLYRLLGEQQQDEKRRRLFDRLAESEEGHARQFADRIAALGGTPPQDSTAPTPAQRLLVKTLGTDAMLRRLEADEERNIAQFDRHAQALAEDAESHALFTRIEAEEKQHATMIHSLKSPEEPKTRLEAMLKAEKWHVSTGSWIGDAIYGINDGLGAVFGVVSGMAGYAGTRQDSLHFVLASGLVATLASALSMGSSAFMAAKSEREVYEAEIGRERAEIEQSPEHEREELALLYQLKGFSETEAQEVAERISRQPDEFLKTMAQEELGLSERRFPNAWIASVSAALSTAVGGILPVLPFFFLSGGKAVIAAAVVGMAAHFAVGAAKSLITARSWWESGLEMTLIGFLTGGVTYGIGKMFHIG